MIPFLKNVARVLVSRSDIDNYCIVVPNKRSGTFLLRHFQEEIQELVNQGKMQKWEVKVAPKIVSITDFICEISDLEIDSRIDMLFTLYSLYRKRPDAVDDFDSFKVWGETALADFNDVDLYCADADSLFSNLKKYNDIQSNYLTDEQQRVAREYFNLPDIKSDTFWRHINPDGNATEKFLRLWEVLGDLYKELGAELEKRQLAWPGRAARRALERIIREGNKALPYAQVVFVGFNALTTVEYRILRETGRLKVSTGRGEESLADYYWDAYGEILQSEELASASHFLSKDKKAFPSKHELTECSGTTGFPKVLKAISCPGNTAQVKVASELISDILRRDKSVATRPGGLAVAMPDENLFFPMLYSLPSELNEVNITMGYPLRMTAAASWFSLLRRLNLRSRRQGEACEYLQEDITSLLSHPLSRLLLGAEVCSAIVSHITGLHIFQTSIGSILDELQPELTPETEANLKLLFRSMREGSATELCAHLIALVEAAAKALAESDKKGGGMLKSDLELKHLEAYALALRRLSEAIALHRTDMDWKTFLSLLDHLLASEKVPLEGEPLTGVQVLGMLETRSLDFDYIIIPSMNERVFPRRLRSRSFIPNNLRIANSMATTQFQEGIFAYYFYRLISRAKEVYMLYDARQGGLRSGDPSRYIYQLKYLFADKAGLREESRNVSVAITGTPPVVAAKGPVMEQLNLYLDAESGKTLSASALKTYMNCPLQFFFKYIKHYPETERQDESMDAKTQGTIFHATMESIYNGIRRAAGQEDMTVPDFAGVEVKAGDIARLLRPLAGTEEADPRIKGEDTESGLAPEVEETVDSLIRTEYMHRPEGESCELNGMARIFRRPIMQNVRKALLSDLELTPMRYCGSEFHDEVRYQLDPEGDPDKWINMKLIIDRIDRVDGVLRVIDYKTGADEADFKDASELFKEGYSKKRAIFQLMLYATLLAQHRESDDPMRIGLVRPTKTGIDPNANVVLYKGEELRDYRTVKGDFEKLLREKLKEIFDPNIPFTQCKPSDCKYCDFKVLCGR